MQWQQTTTHGLASTHRCQHTAKQSDGLSVEHVSFPKSGAPVAHTPSTNTLAIELRASHAFQSHRQCASACCKASAGRGRSTPPQPAIGGPDTCAVSDCRWKLWWCKTTCWQPRRQQLAEQQPASRKACFASFWFGHSHLQFGSVMQNSMSHTMLWYHTPMCTHM